MSGAVTEPLRRWCASCLSVSCREVIMVTAGKVPFAGDILDPRLKRSVFGIGRGASRERRKRLCVQDHLAAMADKYAGCLSLAFLVWSIIRSGHYSASVVKELGDEQNRSRSTCLHCKKPLSSRHGAYSVRFAAT